MSILLFRIAAILCFLAVALGAFGAHGLRSTLEAHGMLDAWNKAVLYHFIHGIALFVLALFGTANRGAWWLLFAGIFLFSGSLYVMALTNLRWIGAITPLGGICFLGGLGMADYCADTLTRGVSPKPQAIEVSRPYFGWNLLQDALF